MSTQKNYFVTGANRGLGLELTLYSLFTYSITVTRSIVTAFSFMVFLRITDVGSSVEG